jgi:hypothetical protein
MIRSEALNQNFGVGDSSMSKHKRDSRHAVKDQATARGR